MNSEEIVYLIQSGIDTENNLKRLYEDNKKYIYKIALKYASCSEIEDLMQEAYFGLYNAVKKYESNQEVKFMTYASYWIESSIRRYIENNGKVIRIPAYMQNLMSQYKRTVALYYSQYGENPDEHHLCKELRINHESLIRLKKSIDLYYTIKSLDEPLSNEEDGSYYDVITGNDGFEEDLVNKCAEEEQPLWSIVQENTDECENKVLIKYYKEGKSYDQVGNEVGLSRERVRTLEVRGIRKLRKEKVKRLLQEKYDIAMAAAYKGGVGRFKNTWTSSTENAVLKLNGYR